MFLCRSYRCDCVGLRFSAASAVVSDRTCQLPCSVPLSWRQGHLRQPPAPALLSVPSGVNSLFVTWNWRLGSAFVRGQPERGGGTGPTRRRHPQPRASGRPSGGVVMCHVVELRTKSDPQRHRYPMGVEKGLHWTGQAESQTGLSTEKSAMPGNERYLPTSS